MAMPRATQSRLAARMSIVTPRLRDVLVEAGDVMPYIYFPLGGIMSILAVTDDGDAVEISTVGSEGMVGVPVVLGQGRSHHDHARVHARAHRDALFLADELGMIEHARVAVERAALGQGDQVTPLLRVDQEHAKAPQVTVARRRQREVVGFAGLQRVRSGDDIEQQREVRGPQEYFDDIQDVKVTKDVHDLARHIVNQKAGHFEPDKFEDQYETALLDLINQKRAGKPITAKERPRGENVVDLMDALRKSIGGAEAAKDPKPAKKPRKVASGQKEMLLPIAGKKPAKEAAAKKPAAKSQRKSA